MKLAIVGTGISGIMAASILHERGHAITVYEASDHVGGHVKTLHIPIHDIDHYLNHSSIPTQHQTSKDEPCIIELGVFMHDPKYIHPVMNQRIKKLGIKIKELPLSLTFENRLHDLSWVSQSHFTGNLANLDIFLRTTKNSLRYGMKRLFRNATFLLELRRLFNHAPIVFRTPRYRQMSLKEYIIDQGLSELLLDSWLLPQMHCWWGISRREAMDSSIAVILESFDLVSRAPQYLFVDGWDHFVRALYLPFSQRIRTGCRIEEVIRYQGGVEVNASDGSEKYDAVILAVPPNIAHELIRHKSTEEDQILQQFTTTTTTVYLHTDKSWMPTREKWSVINQIQDDRGSFTTVWIGALDERKPGLFLSWIDDDNSETSSKPDLIVNTARWLRTLPNIEYLNACTDISSIQGKGRIWHCGAHVHAIGAGAGKMIPSLWHENAYRSGIAAGEALDLHYNPLRN